MNMQLEKKSKPKTNLITYIVIIIFSLIALGIKKCNQHTKDVKHLPDTSINSDWRHQKLVYTKHARCRMDCRDISESEVESILYSGVINETKSQEENDEAAGHCPTYALEGTTSDGQHVRIVYGACDKITKVITAIDLGVEHQCDCR